ncbi:protein kinase C-binding protein NELL1 isoform X2 [Leptinotarsa decemlineata]|uniref:protein kinase C-binding protein NELL1 isoform X2 n=1 Tax=Leptinotarsa decemlineata TaxID=7539 RepID=UPI000C252770|nr:protein kinase C-binding protein NELL1-like isoform X2 [Leptinotarsa decemlineata]
MAFLITVWTTLLWLASATGFDPTFPAGPISFLSQSIDLLKSLGSYNSSWEGVTLYPEGPDPHLRPAYLLQGDFRDLKLPPSELNQVIELLRSNSEFTISARLKQEPRNTGSIISFAHGINRYLELQSSSRADEIRLSYITKLNSKVYVEKFPYRLNDNKWHDIVVSVSGPEVELLVDCKSLFKRVLRMGEPIRNFPGTTQLWIGQRNNMTYPFKGGMQNVRLIGGPHGYLSSCPDLDSTCPSCGQFFQLQNTVQELTRHLQELSERLVVAESRISKVEECDCHKSCHLNGTIYADGAKWQSKCDICSCVHGTVECQPVKCPEPPCKHPVNISGRCCQSCLKNCLFNGQFYDHGEVITVKKCVDCECKDGSMKCNKTDPEKSCPKLNCPPEKQFSVPDHCCMFCPGVDYCAKGHYCHANASCLNLQTTYACQCDQGFHGDGRMCSDIDECQQEGGLDGHHCHQNTRCVNIPGSYECECLPGYRRIDKFNCAELDECSTGEHNCDVNAECINSEGSYHCVCKDGYTGDGYSCQPVCSQKCLNGGICRRPGKCACPNGYTGSSCELDLDECATDSHRCTNTSVCVNMIGWYYCKCDEGYENRYKDNNSKTICLDINECNSDLHTCHPSAQCINTNGKFVCECPPNRPECKLSCIFEGNEILSGESVSPRHDPCEICTCQKGVMTCEKPKCDCTSPDAKENPCCPRCNERHACRHQELPNVILNHGDQWSYQCQVCECLYGDIDCEEMICPPLLCDNPVLNPEDCCHHCEDLCSSGNGNSSASGQQCSFAGRMYDSGSQIIDPKDPCTACNCKDGQLCCSYNFDCGDNPRAVGYDGLVASKNETTSSDSALFDVTKHSSVLRLATNSAGFSVSDSRSSETENSRAPRKRLRRASPGG